MTRGHVNCWVVVNVHKEGFKVSMNTTRGIGDTSLLTPAAVGK